MYQISDVVVYRNQLCRIAGKQSHHMTGEMCYVLVPYYGIDQSTHMVVPVANKGGHLRPLFSRSEIDSLLDRARDLQVDEACRTNMKSRYLLWLNSNDPLNLFRIIKTACVNNRKRMIQRRPPAQVDQEFLQRAEGLLAEEFSVVLGLSVEETKVYLTDQMMKEE